MFFVLLLLFIQFNSIHLQHPSTFIPYNLDSICGQDGSKQSLHLNSQAAVFTFNSTNKRKLDCHLELHLHSKALGFSVFIETLKIEKSSRCFRDFLQFGRDKFVITTHTSDKYCDTIEHSANITNEDGALVGYDFKDTSFTMREYIEDHDLEMDIWLELETTQDDWIKEVKLVVVPFRKSVDAWDEEYYKECPGTSRWFWRQFFCSGVVKCAVLTEEEFSKYCVKKDPGGFMFLPAIIIGFAVLMSCTFLLCFALKIMLNHFNSNEQPRNCISPSNIVPDGSGHIVASLLTPERGLEDSKDIPGLSFSGLSLGSVQKKIYQICFFLNTP